MSFFKPQIHKQWWRGNGWYGYALVTRRRFIGARWRLTPPLILRPSEGTRGGGRRPLALLRSLGLRVRSVIDFEGWPTRSNGKSRRANKEEMERRNGCLCHLAKSAVNQPEEARPKQLVARTYIGSLRTRRLRTRSGHNDVDGIWGTAVSHE